MRTLTASYGIKLTSDALDEIIYLVNGHPELLRRALHTIIQYGTNHGKMTIAKDDITQSQGFGLSEDFESMLTKTDREVVRIFQQRVKTIAPVRDRRVFGSRARGGRH